MLAVALVSLAGRIFALWIAGDRVPIGDPYNYVVIAQNILAGRGLVIDDPFVLTNLRAFYPPGYPLLLAGVGLIAPLNAAALTALNSLLDLAAAALIVRIGRRLGEKQAGRLAGALYLLWPASIFLAPLAYKEGLIALLVLAQIAGLLDAARGRRWAWARFGLAAGLTPLVQPGLAPLSVLLALAIFGQFSDRRTWLVNMGAAAALAAAVMLPWWVRNAILFDRFIPFTTASGAGLWVGASPLGGGEWVPIPPRLRVGDELALSAAMSGEAWATIAADPFGYFVRCLAKVLRALTHDQSPLLQLYWMRPLEHRGLILALQWLNAPLMPVTLCLTIVGAFVERHSITVRLLLASLAQILLFGMWFEFSERHRYFLMPLMLLVAAIGAVHWLKSRGSAGPRAELAT